MAPGASAETLRRARAVLARDAGLAIDDRRDDLLASSLQALAGALGVPGPDEALDACERQPRAGGPLDTLVRSVLVRETHVFRTREHFEALQRVVLPEILERKAGERRFRAWSAGCATGEEAWSAAFALHGAASAAGTDLSSWDLLLLGTDVDPESLETARRAEYREYSFRGVTPSERSRFFEPRGEEWRVRDPWRGLVTFRRHDLVREAPPATIAGADLILCRNVLMYFTPEAAHAVLAALAATLGEGGWLLVGAAEHGLVQGGLPLELHALPDAIAYRRLGPPRMHGHLLQSPQHVLASAASAPSPSMAPPSPAPQSRARGAADEAPPADALGPARAALVSGDRNQAAELAVTALEQQPEDADACLFLGRLAADAGHSREADAWLRRALALRPGDAEAAYLLALLARERGEADDAAELAEAAVSRRPGFVMALQLLARIRRERGDEAGADHALDEALRALAALPDDAPVPHAHDLTAAHLRSALTALRRPARPVRP